MNSRSREQRSTPRPKARSLAQHAEGNYAGNLGYVCDRSSEETLTGRAL